MDTEFFIPVHESSQTANARRAAGEIARRLAFDQTEAGNLAIIVTEAATNTVKHGGGGVILLRVIENGGRQGVEMLALDKGPGMANTERCFQDGFSTAGSPGTGLGAISRLAASYDIYSAPGLGTALMTRTWAGRRVAKSERDAFNFETGAVRVPKAGEEVCGDSWVVHDRPAGPRLMVADGLGHGPSAAEAARTAVRVSNEHVSDSAVDLLGRLHRALRATRGAALAVAEIDCARALVRFAGLGNIAGCILSNNTRRQMVSHNGTAGHQAHKLQDFSYPWRPGSVLILHSDGVATHWSPDRYPGLFSRHPSIIAGVLYRDFNRGRDDVTVVAMRQHTDGQWPGEPLSRGCGT